MTDGPAFVSTPEQYPTELLNFNTEAWVPAMARYHVTVNNFKFIHSVSFKFEENNPEIPQIRDVADKLGWELSLHYARGVGPASIYYICNNDATAMVIQGKNNVSSTIFARTEEVAKQIESDIAQFYPEVKLKADNDYVPVSFWSCDSHGSAYSREREITTLGWEDILINYAPSVRSDLNSVMNLVPPLDGGKLILWHGVPGTGKSNAIRALARSWMSWCNIHYVVDPEAFFGNANYMLSVILEEANDDEWFWDECEQDFVAADDPQYVLQGKERWKLLIVEDADEFLRSDAKDRTGQALSRLLNLGDGLIGQGLNYVTLLTTNEKIANIHSAVARKGRCISNIEFAPISRDQAKVWLIDNGVDTTLTSGQQSFTLAELYDLKHAAKQIKSEETPTSTGMYL